MIRSFRCRDTEALFRGKTPRRFRAMERAAQRKLQYLADATDVRDLAAPPGNRLERLRGDREGQWSVRINDQWRLCSRWEDDGAHDVEIVDYH